MLATLPGYRYCLHLDELSFVAEQRDAEECACRSGHLRFLYDAPHCGQIRTVPRYHVDRRLEHVLAPGARRPECQREVVHYLPRLRDVVPMANEVAVGTEGNGPGRHDQPFPR